MGVDGGWGMGKNGRKSTGPSFSPLKGEVSSFPLLDVYPFPDKAAFLQGTQHLGVKKCLKSPRNVKLQYMYRPALILIMKLKLTNIKEPVNRRWQARLQKRMVHQPWEDLPLPPRRMMDLLRNVTNKS